MRPLFCLITGLLLLAVSSVEAAPKMRPYSGIGVLRISTVGLTDPIPYYDEPGLMRQGNLPLDTAQKLNSGIFDSSATIFLMVKARKGQWLRVERDDAGRESWLLQQRHWQYTPWQQFLKSQYVTFLPNSPKRLMQVANQPEASQGTPRTAQSPPMRIIMAQGDWAYVLLDQNNAGWIRWREADGRLLVRFHE